MILRRFLLAVFSLALLATASVLTSDPAHAGYDMVQFGGYAPGTIVIQTSQRRLYFVVAPGQARRYPVGVGKAGKAWAGRSYIEDKRLHPAWAPPADIKAENPRLPDYIPGGSPNNPMGAAAMALKGGEYAIHGTNRPDSIGGFVSYGCIRMYNSDVLELYSMVPIGTPVVVLR
jgi:lipoprotein-anchoring transpeptidase ErfK/SrfK